MFRNNWRSQILTEVWAAGLVAIFCLGCGDDRPKVMMPENPVPPPAKGSLKDRSASSKLPAPHPESLPPSAGK